MTYELEMVMEYGIGFEELLEIAGIDPKEWNEEG